MKHFVTSKYWKSIPRQKEKEIKYQVFSADIIANSCMEILIQIHKEKYLKQSYDLSHLRYYQSPLRGFVGSFFFV